MMKDYTGKSRSISASLHWLIYDPF